MWSFSGDLVYFHATVYCKGHKYTVTIEKHCYTENIDLLGNDNFYFY